MLRYLPFDPKECGILEMVHLPTLLHLINNVPRKT
jgi:hypothetical protein